MTEQARSALNAETLDVVADRGYYDSEEIYGPVLAGLIIQTKSETEPF